MGVSAVGSSLDARGPRAWGPKESTMILALPLTLANGLTTIPNQGSLSDLQH